LAKVQAKLTKDEPALEGYYPAVVKKIDDEHELAELQIGTKHTGSLPLAGMRWARKPNPNAYYPSSLISKVKSALSEGDVILVRQRTADELKVDVDTKFVKLIPESGDLYSLEQEPQLQGAIISLDPHKDYVPAMIGGYDYDASEFNRAFQACRQPGSSFKPLTYSAAIELLDYTASTVIVDSPIVTDDPETQLRWKPQNYEEDYKGDVIVRTALMESMNIPAIKTFQAVGIDKMRDWAKKLGLSTEVHSDLSSALGSSCVHPWELANVYAVFDRDGRKEQVFFVRQVRDRFNRVLEDHTAYDDPWASFSDRVQASYAHLFDKPDQVMLPETAFLITSLLKDVATGGTGAQASRLNKPVAGKTGTTNDSHDTWFVGFTKELVTAVWLGYDDYKHDPMARYEAGSKASLPIWLDYMKHALDGVPQPQFQPAPGADITFARIDAKTGKLAKPGAPNSVQEAFKRGNEPEETEGEESTQGGGELNPLMMP
jgi:penicillin-binding protein 1A